MMWDTILGLFTGGISSILAGGATGLLGIAVQGFFDMKTKQLELEVQKSKQDHEVNMVKANGELMDKEWRGRMQVAQIEGDAKVQVADASAFAASFNTEPTRYAEGKRPSGWVGKSGWALMVLVDFFRGSIRPALTVYLCVLTTLIYYQAQSILERYGMVIEAKEAFGLVIRIIETILYLTTTCLLWWFGTRNKEKELTPAQIRR